MDLKQIRDFVAVYEEGGFTKAAKRENATQPGMSLQIASLEAELGSPLFDRGARGVSPTSAGKRLYTHALKILAAVTVAKEDLRWLRGEVSGTVTVGLPTPVFRGRFAQLLLNYTSRFPAVDLRIVEGHSSDALSSMLVSHEVDFALVSPGFAASHLHMEPFYSSPLVMVSGISDRKPASIKVRDLPPLKLVLTSPGSGLRARIDELVKLWDIQVRQVVCVDGLSGMLDFMRLSDWTTFLPAVAVLPELREGLLRVTPVVEPKIEIEYVLARGSSAPLSQAAREFLAVLHDELHLMDRELDSLLNKRGAKSRRAKVRA